MGASYRFVGNFISFFITFHSADLLSLLLLFYIFFFNFCCCFFVLFFFFNQKIKNKTSHLKFSTKKQRKEFVMEEDNAEKEILSEQSEDKESGSTQKCGSTTFRLDGATYTIGE